MIKADHYHKCAQQFYFFNLQDRSWKVISTTRPGFIIRLIFRQTPRLGSGQPAIVPGLGHLIFHCYKQQYERPTHSARSWTKSFNTQQSTWTTVSKWSFEDKLHRLPRPHKCCSVCLWPRSSRSATPSCWSDRHTQNWSRLWGRSCPDGYVSQHGWLSCTSVRRLRGSQLRMILPLLDSCWILFHVSRV